MNSSKNYYKDINLIRLLACIAILLYHLNILKGGYLAVCVFFVLSGYLSCISAFKKEKFCLLSYYSNRLLKIYVPLLLVVFITISVISLFPNIIWFNLKPETTSILLGYNNFWQLEANLDYFARHINSPFMHLWYISILLQFDLIFPFIYIVFRKIGDKIKKIIPCIISLLLAIAFSLYFYKMNLTYDMMTTYYNTFTRIFSLLFGLSLGFFKFYYGSLVPKKIKNSHFNRIIFYLYLLILICLFIFIDAESNYFLISMLAATLIAVRLIDYGTNVIKNDLSIFDKFIKFLSDISYEIYLIQYPVIFLFQYININNYLKIFIIIILTFVLSYILHFCINSKKDNKIYRIIKYVMCTILLSICLYGIYQYIVAKDYTMAMQELESQLAQNQKIIEQKQAEYESKIKQEENDWLSILSELENGEKEIENIVSNLSVVGIGDSVMLGAVENLYKQFPNGYFDAKVSRTAWEANDILQNLKNRNILGEPVILNLGANGDCSIECKIEIIEKCEGRQIFWINVTNDDYAKVNDKLLSLADKYDNVQIIDWNSISSGHPEYFVADGIHLTEIGKAAYTTTIYDSIYQFYLKEYNKKKENVIKQHEEELKNKISFFGNDILLNAFDYIQANFPEAKFAINNDFNYEILKETISNSINDNSLNYKVVFAFDNNIELSKAEYQQLIELCQNHEIYILATNKGTIDILSNFNFENVIIINFYNQIQFYKNYLMADGIHLTDDGNKGLSEILKDMLIFKREKMLFFTNNN